MNVIKVPANYYQNFDADFNRDVPAEGYGGWKKKEFELSLKHTAVVSLHVWDCGTREQYPGWHRSLEWIPRDQEICRTIFPKLLSAVRASGIKLYHVVGGGRYHEKYPGYKITS